MNKKKADYRYQKKLLYAFFDPVFSKAIPVAIYVSTI
jgi:hypothetical protein